MDIKKFLYREFRTIGVDTSNEFIITLIRAFDKVQNTGINIPSLRIAHYRVSDIVTTHNIGLLYKYDTTNEYWEPQDISFPGKGRKYAALTRDDSNIIWLCGGYNKSGLKDVWKFDGSAWNSGPDMPQNLYGHSATIINNKLYIFCLLYTSPSPRDRG